MEGGGGQETQAAHCIHRGRTELLYYLETTISQSSVYPDTTGLRAHTNQPRARAFSPVISEPTQDVSCHNEHPLTRKKKRCTNPQALTKTSGRESHLSFVTRSVFPLVVGWSTEHNRIQMKATREGLQTGKVVRMAFQGGGEN